MKANKPYRSFMITWGAMIFLSIAAAHARQLGAVAFANGSTHPTRIGHYLLDQAKADTQKPGQVILLRAGASPVGGRAYNFVLSGERAAVVRNSLVGAGIPRRKIVSQFVGIVDRGSAAADRAVIVDATTRAALANGGKQVAVHQATPAQVRKLQSEVEALQAAQAQAHKPKPKVASHNYVGSVWYVTRTTQFNTGAVVGVTYSSPTGIGGGIAGASVGMGDNYQARGYGFSIRTARPINFNFWTPWSVPLEFGFGGLSQTTQVTNPVLSGTQGVTYLPDGVLFYPINARDNVSTQFLHASIASPMWKILGVTVTPGVKIGWLGEQSLAGGESTQPLYQGCTAASNGGNPCPTMTVASTQAAGGSAISVTPSLAISGQGWQVAYSQSPWGGQGYAAPRVLMGTVVGHGVRLSMGAAFPNSQVGTITTGRFVKLGVRRDGWGATAIWVGGEQFESGGSVMPATLAQALAPFNPSHPWNSYNPGITISLKKRLAAGVWVDVAYGIDHQSGAGYEGPNNIPISAGTGTVTLPSPQGATAVTKTEEISLKGRF
jgi:hypothetical protein